MKHRVEAEVNYDCCILPHFIGKPGVCMSKFSECLPPLCFHLVEIATALRMMH